MTCVTAMPQPLLQQESCHRQHVKEWLRLRSRSGLVANSCLTLATPGTVAHQAPLSIGFSRQEYWSGLPFPTPGNLPNPVIELSGSFIAGRFFPTEPPGKPLYIHDLAYYTNYEYNF